MGRGTYTFLFVIYLIIGLYLLNFAFGLIPMPDFILSIEKWIVAIAGIITIVAGFAQYRKGRMMYGY